MAEIKKLELEFGNDSPFLIHTDLQVTDEKLQPIHPSFSKFIGINPHRSNANNILVQNVVTGSTMLFNRKLADLCHPIPNEALMHDWWISIIAFTLGHVVYLNEATVDYRQHESNVIGAKKWTVNPASLVNSAIRSIFSNRIQDVFEKSINQAEKIRIHLTSKDPDFCNPTLNSFINLPNQGWFAKRVSLIKNGFLKGKLIQNIGMILQKH